MRLCGGVFEGGGVRGIGHVGAACAMEAAGYQFVDLAGSSAGALVAALLAAGYQCRELKREMMALNYAQFKGMDWMDHFGTVGKALSLLFTLGIYHTGYLEQWMKQMLEPKGIRTFGDISETGRRLFLTVSDLTRRRLLVLPGDAPELGMEPEEFPVALAVRMSSSIPVFFEPVRMRDGQGETHILVDGGLLSNYPVWVLDDGVTRRPYPTFGFQFRGGSPSGRAGCTGRPGLAEYLKSIMSTCIDVIDNNYAAAGDDARTIWISPVIGEGKAARTIGSTDFGITQAESQALFDNGRQAAETFLKTWDFADWERRYRSKINFGKR